MKLAISKNIEVSSLDELKAIDYNSLNNGDCRSFDGVLYKFFVNASEGVKPNLNQGLGRWVSRPNTEIYLVDDDYDFNNNNASDITSIPLLLRNSNLFIDYKLLQTSIKSHITLVGWVALNDSEKDIAIDYYAHNNDVDKVTHLMGKGMSQSEAQHALLMAWKRYNNRYIESLKKRWDYVPVIALQYLSIPDAEDLFNTVKNLHDKLLAIALIGKNYGDNTNGIMDFIESTNAYMLTGMRYSLYNLLEGTWDEFETKIKECLIDGKYELI